MVVIVVVMVVSLRPLHVYLPLFLLPLLLLLLVLSTSDPLGRKEDGAQQKQANHLPGNNHDTVEQERQLNDHP